VVGTSFKIVANLDKVVYNTHKENMLAQKHKETPYIAVFKIHTGEEFIASVIEETSSEYIIKNPLCIVSTAKGPQFAPLLMLGEPGKPVKLSKPVVATTDAGVEIESQYESITTGIALPQKSAIITS